MNTRSRRGGGRNAKVRDRVKVDADFRLPAATNLARLAVLIRSMSHGSTFYRALHQMGIFGLNAPTRLRERHGAGQRTPTELIDQYHLVCRPIRDLLVDYLSERQPAVDYSSLRALAADLGTCSGKTWNATNQ